jgi:hypothetical protein
VEPALEAILPIFEIVLPVTAPLRTLLAVAVDWLKASLNMPVEPLLRAADCAAAVKAAPELLLVLLSLLSAVELEVDVDVDVNVLLLSVVAVFMLLSVCEATLLLVPPLSENWVVATCEYAALLNPNAIAMAETMSDFFMEPPEVVEVELRTMSLRCVTANRESRSNIGASPSPHQSCTQGQSGKDK